jgi:DivIVA domain-containing protein
VWTASFSLTCCSATSTRYAAELARDGDDAAVTLDRLLRNLDEALAAEAPGSKMPLEPPLPRLTAIQSLGVPPRRSFLLTPEDIANVELPRAMIGGYNREAIDDLLDRIVMDVRARVDERDSLEAEVRRLKEALSKSEVLERERVEAQEATRRECELMLKEARRQADEILNAAENETAARVEALKRVERVHGLMRVELRKLLGAMLEELSTPSKVVREALKDRQLAEDLQHITRRAIEAGAAPVPVGSGEPGVPTAEAPDETLPATTTSRLPERITHWTSHDPGE